MAQIKSLKHLKDVLKNIPDEDLESLGFNYHDEGEEVTLLCWDAEADPVERWDYYTKKYPGVLEIDRWVRAIIKVGIKSYEQEIDDSDMDDMISSADIAK